jgi:choline dehydrogenase-like flavoprotein
MQDSDKFPVVVIGSGFGGTIAALTFAALFEERNQGKEEAEWERVCILERGQWWVSHEIPFTPQDKRPDNQRNMLEFLRDEDQPYGFWAHPDNVKGITRLLSMARQVNRRGLYDYRPIGQADEDGNTNLTVLCASGVGGGSLVYANVTAAPPASVWETWPTEKGTGRSLGDYFSPARDFIGTNKITTVAGLTGQELERPRIFHAAVKDALGDGAPIMNKIVKGEPDTALDLAITDVPSNAFESADANTLRRYKNPFQTNVCERQARCNLGCIPGARHTLNKRLWQALEKNKPLEVRPLCEAIRIDYTGDREYPYRVTYRRIRRREDGQDEIEPAVVSARILILAAGTLGTTELLLKSTKGKDSKLVLSECLGQGFSTDGDLLGYIKLQEKRKEKPVDNTRGPINTSHALFSGRNGRYVASVEDTAISPMVADAFATIFEIDSEGAKEEEEIKGEARLTIGQRFIVWWRRARRRFWLFWRFPGLGILLGGTNLTNVRGLLEKLMERPRYRNALQAFSARFDQSGEAFQLPEHKDQGMERLIHKIIRSLFADLEDPYASPARRLEQFFIFSGMGVDKATGVFDLQPDWKKLEAAESNVKVRPPEKLHLGWKSEDNKEEFGEVIGSMQHLANAIQKGAGVRTPGWSMTDPAKRSVFVLHPLGGCRMGLNAKEGVVNEYGEVFRGYGSTTDVYPGLCVMDGSVIPGALGINSSLTIMAVTLRCVEHAVELELNRKPTWMYREPWDYWPVEFVASLTRPDDVSERTDVECNPLAPFPDPKGRTLPIIRQQRGKVVVPRAMYPQGAVVLWDDPTWVGEFERLPIRGSTGPEVRFGETELQKKEFEGIKGVVAWFL